MWRTLWFCTWKYVGIQHRLKIVKRTISVLIDFAQTIIKPSIVRLLEANNYTPKKRIKLSLIRIYTYTAHSGWRLQDRQSWNGKNEALKRVSYKMTDLSWNLFAFFTKGIIELTCSGTTNEWAWRMPHKNKCDGHTFSHDDWVRIECFDDYVDGPIRPE